jgi:Ni/Fe-hydrogenase subunit HybB-like protein
MPAVRMVALALVAVGVITYRWDTNISGLMVILSYLPGEAAVFYTNYRPALIEIAAGLGLIGYALTMISFGVRYLKVVDHTPVEEHVPEAHLAPQPVPG